MQLNYAQLPKTDIFTSRYWRDPSCTQLSLPDHGWLPSQPGSFACNTLLTLRAFFPPFPAFPGPLLWATFDRKLDTSLKLSFVFHFEPFFFPPKPNFWFLYRLLAFGLKNNRILPIFLSSRSSQEGTCICWETPISHSKPFPSYWRGRNEHISVSVAFWPQFSSFIGTESHLRLMLTNINQNSFSVPQNDPLKDWKNQTFCI